MKILDTNCYQTKISKKGTSPVLLSDLTNCMLHLNLSDIRQQGLTVYLGWLIQYLLKNPNFYTCPSANLGPKLNSMLKQLAKAAKN